MNLQKAWPPEHFEWDLGLPLRRLWRSWPFLLLTAFLTIEFHVFRLLFDSNVFDYTQMWMERTFPFLYSPADNIAERSTCTILAFYIVFLVLNMIVVLPARRKGLQSTLIVDMEALPHSRLLRAKLLFDIRLLVSSVLALLLPLLAACLLDQRFGEYPASLISSFYPLLLLLCFLLADRAVVLGTLSPGAGMAWKLASLALIPLGFMGMLPCVVSLLAIPWAVGFLSLRVWIGLGD